MMKLDHVVGLICLVLGTILAAITVDPFFAAGFVLVVWGAALLSRA